MSGSDPIVRLRGLVVGWQLLGRAVADAVADCQRAGVDRTTVAALLGVHRSTLYRWFPAGEEAPGG